MCCKRFSRNYDCINWMQNMLGQQAPGAPTAPGTYAEKISPTPPQPLGCSWLSGLFPAYECRVGLQPRQSSLCRRQVSRLRPWCAGEHGSCLPSVRRCEPGFDHAWLDPRPRWLNLPIRLIQPTQIGPRHSSHPHGLARLRAPWRTPLYSKPKPGLQQPQILVMIS